MDYVDLTDEELEAENQRLMSERTRVGDEQDLIAAVRDSRASARKVAAFVDGLSDAERSVIVDAVAAQVGAGATTPGGN